jgi:ABC-2 type transport system ATP-binding protein
MFAIEAKGLTKRYRSMRRDWSSVVDNIDLEVRKGEIYGFLGPNGAGKTTTIKMILGITYATSGELKVLGKEADSADVHQQVSYLPERPYYYEHLTGLEVLMFFASLFGIKDKNRCKELLARVHLNKDMDKQISHYSKGMLQRIGLAQCLINDPKLLILDEPTAGLDPIAHTEIRDLILDLRNEGKTIFISSHELSEVERICDRIAIIDQGKIRRQGELSHLLDNERTRIKLSSISNKLNSALSEIPNSKFTQNSEQVIFEFDDSKSLDDMIDLIRQHNGKIHSIVPCRKRLEDLYLETIQSGANS